ncbi:hypothetical protein A9Q93_12925 [Nonlabens dokdonensis]|uniref:DUF3987 domain-containing protein n=1 Tax=Nonlabens dokdonensis TaxID=328515 RepID=A0A1Z8AJE0_9FLAO|nr:DUF3987 domain-containing protein [Nonlabens dokdonensis]OUS10451.1 hypothetical protein A9Q93_12925 [Nonlabens dokdonensis]
MSKKTKKISEELHKEYNNLTNIFPIEIFPDEVKEYIEQSTRNLRFNKEFLCCSTLSALSTAFGNTYRLQVKEEWHESPMLWIVLIGNAGDAKSHVMKLPYSTLFKHEKENYLKYQLQQKEYELSTTESAIKPIFKDIILKDFTYEALCKSLDHNHRGLCMFQDEFTSFLGGFTKYSNESHESSYLTLFNGDGIKANRTSSEIKMVFDPFANLLAGTQKTMLKAFFKRNRNTTGFLERFLFCFPDKVYPVTYSNNLNDPIIIQNFECLFERIIELYDDNLFTKLSYSTEASSYAQYLSKKLYKTNRLGEDISRALGAKLNIYLHRFSLLIELIECVSKDQKIRCVNVDSVKKAEKLLDYFLQNAIKVFENADNPFANLSKTDKDLFDSLPQNFTTAMFLEKATNLDIPKSTAEKKLRRNHGLYIKIRNGNYEKFQ